MSVWVIRGVSWRNVESNAIRKTKHKTQNTKHKTSSTEAHNILGTIHTHSTRYTIRSMDDNNSSQESNNDHHVKFIESLEAHGTKNDPNVWKLIASDLGWTIEETKLYSYRYMHELQEELQHCRANNDGINSEWSLEEVILFENILLAYSHLDLVMNDDSKWLEISFKLPSKTIEQCKARYKEMYQGSRNGE